MTREELLAALLVERFNVRPTPTPPHLPVKHRPAPVDELAAARRRRARNLTTKPGRTATA